MAGPPDPRRHRERASVSLPLWHLPPGPLLLVVDVGAWAVVHSVTGYAVHRLPVRRLDHDTWLFRARRFERDGRFYRDTLHIHRWKDALPEAGALFPGGMSKRHLPPSDRGGLERFAVETRRAELGHWLAAACGPLFALWNPAPIAAVMLIYGVAVNLPFIAIQRYNRLRVTRVRRSKGSRGTSSARTRNDRGTNGASMPNGSPPKR